MAHSLTLSAVIQLKPDQAIEQLHILNLSSEYATYQDLYVRLALACILKEKYVLTILIILFYFI